MKILITTGIYPPKIGGPAQYAKNLLGEFQKLGHEVSVRSYFWESKLPTGIRHLFFFFKIIPVLSRSQAVFALDTFSVGWPTVLACKIFGKECIIRTGGDFLWEQYVERTKKKILFKDFYKTEMKNFSIKEKIVFRITKWTLHNASKIIFSTKWQRDIFVSAYNLNLERTYLVENYYGLKESDLDYDKMIFVASARNLFWKNLDLLQTVFAEIKSQNPKLELFTDNLTYSEFMVKMSRAYAVVLISLGDISPNMILDAIRLNRPFICTREIGIYERIKDAGIFVDPLNETEIKKAILDLASPQGYWQAKEKVRSFNFVHTWGEIAQQFLSLVLPAGKNQSGLANIIKNIFHSFMAVRFFLCGITSAGINIFALYIFTDVVGIWYLYSSILAFLISLITSFLLQKFIVFKDRKTHDLPQQFSKFSLALILGTITNTILIYIFVEWFNIWYILSQIMAGIFVMVQNFLLYKIYIFKKRYV